MEEGWDELSGAMSMAVYNGQLASATMTDHYVNTIDTVQGFTAMDTVTDPRQYAGVAPDGRALTPLLYGAVTKTKELTGGGLAVPMAFEAGAAFLAAVVKTVVADMGRIHDQVSMTGRGYKRYVRSVSSNACSRCAILAGIYSSAVAFPRHPNCQCIAVPLADDPRKLGLEKFHSPYAYFDSMGYSEQNRVFTKAGAEAIRNGADMAQVVNARRGAAGISFSGSYGRAGTVPNSGRRLQKVQIGVKPDGSPLMVYMTTEGTTRRGSFRQYQNTLAEANRRTTKLRLMPEQIFRMAGNDPEKARKLLVRYGYITR